MGCTCNGGLHGSALPCKPACRLTAAGAEEASSNDADSEGVGVSRPNSSETALAAALDVQLLWLDTSCHGCSMKGGLQHCGGGSASTLGRAASKRFVVLVVVHGRYVCEHDVVVERVGSTCSPARARALCALVPGRCSSANNWLAGSGVSAAGADE